MPPARHRIGVFGGTFDPIHTGHLEVAAAVRDSLGLDRMLLVVANQPWQKEDDRSVTPAEDRLAMVELAVAGRPGLEASRLELDRGGPSYTVDTVRQLLVEDPEAEIVLVVGADVVPGLPTWHDEPALRGLVTLAVVRRPGSEAAPVPPGWQAVEVPTAPLDVSSTGLRRRLERGESVEGLVPEAVIRWIDRRGRYDTGR